MLLTTHYLFNSFPQHEVYKERYLAVRVYWIDEWVLHSELLSVRIFQPAKYENRAHGRKLMVDFIETVRENLTGLTAYNNINNHN